ncbi:lipase-like PAD4 isoform X2 [Phragmites australis]|uniref:lipase-like PAD4 isoform X2 n=1 Tax=Phragmites australis TaxID=29695 RepID=UPI002D79CDB5|nr:lipase-like PAD4 isoform X2 [Phragmites australis]
MDDAGGEEEASMFETSHVLGALLASSPLLARAWDRCVAATAAAGAAAPGFLHGEDGGTVYVAFSGVKAALSAADAGAAVAGGSADAFAPVGLGGDAALRLFAPLVAAEPDAAAGEPVAVQALALQRFLKLCGSPDFQMLLNQIRGKAVVFTGHSLGGAIAALAALRYLCISSSSSTWGSAPQVLCITFGSPLLGNEALSRAILRERWSGNFCHVVSQHDIVPRLLFCPLDLVPAHIIIGMQLQQCPAGLRHSSAVTVATTRMADTDQDTLRQLIQMHVGAVALEQKLAAPATPGGSPYRPFGTYVLCSPNGAACLDNPIAAVQMLYATFASRCSPGEDSPEAAHSCYGDLVLKMPQHLLLKRRLSVEDAPSSSNYDAGVSLALEASGIGAKATEASTARQWLKTSKRAVRRPSLNCAHLATRLGRITPCRAQIEWYKALFDVETGYYDAFKQRRSFKKFSKANMNRIKLGQFWDGVLAMLDAGQLPHDFHRRAKWVNAARFYQLLVEPLDIADYHRNNLHRTRGSYVPNGRERRYDLFDRWWQEKGCTGAGGDTMSSTSAASASCRKRSKYAGLTQDPCFWARVEEAREQTESVRSDRDAAELAMKLKVLQEFERYSSELVASREVSVDVLAPQSSYTLWLEEWKQLKLRDEVRTMLLQF